MDRIDYGKLVDEAMHLIVYKVLKKVQQEGLPAEHHFFISFLTHHPLARLSEALKNKYPREMTIVLQYQYENLKVDSNGFGVTLSFSGSKENIYVPFNAITTFADPSVQFGLQFRELLNPAEQEEDLDMEVSLQEEDDDLEKITEAIRKELETKLSKDNKVGTKKKAQQKNTSKKKGDNIVSLDQFRK